VNSEKHRDSENRKIPPQRILAREGVAPVALLLEGAT
jgi:hypothetical protein